MKENIMLHQDHKFVCPQDITIPIIVQFLTLLQPFKITQIAPLIFIREYCRYAGVVKVLFCAGENLAISILHVPQFHGNIHTVDILEKHYF